MSKDFLPEYCWIDWGRQLGLDRCLEATIWCRDRTPPTEQAKSRLKNGEKKNSR